MNTGWKRRAVVADELGRYWLVKSMRFVAGHGVRVHLTRPRMDHFATLTAVWPGHQLIGGLP